MEIMSDAIGVIGTSLVENEKRIPLVIEHLRLIPQKISKPLVIESGYGAHFGYSDELLKDLGCLIASREEILGGLDLVVIPKPTAGDIRKMKKGSALFGWVHAVQQYDIAQAAIENEITLIAWESLNHWDAQGRKLMHLFYRNNELAGYCAVLHCLSLFGLDGLYGPRRKVTILGYGSVSKGAIRALNGRGFNFIHTYTRRKTHLVADRNPDVYFGNYYFAENGEIFVQESDLTHRTILEALCDSDIIVNGILQDTNNPAMFLRESDLRILKPETVLVDVSCDKGMAFSFARPTTFDIPYVKLERNIRYYSVDHTPSYLWHASSREISAVVFSQIEKLAMGSVSWDSDETIKKATEIRQGRIVNSNILEFQHRKPQFPYERELLAVNSDS